MDSARSLKLVDGFPVIGETLIEVDQQPVYHTTIQFGARMTVKRHWDFMLEVGSNFDDAFIAVTIKAA